jgi:Ca2+-dependent lipid-binding protein
MAQREAAGANGTRALSIYSPALMMQAQTNLLPESVEWMNALLSVVWGIVNPDMFQTVADTLEDVMWVNLKMQ